MTDSNKKDETIEVAWRQTVCDQWKRKTFKNRKAMEKWVDKRIETHGNFEMMEARKCEDAGAQDIDREVS